MSDWQPIETAPKGDSVPYVDPLILIGRIESGRVVWAMAVRWAVEMYGYIHCASRSGWAVDYMPLIAMQHNKPKLAGEWVCAPEGYGPTHWMPLPAPPVESKSEVVG
jgi:hypothetical protein